MKTEAVFFAISTLLLNCAAYGETGTFVGYYNTSKAANAALQQETISVRISGTSVSVTPVKRLGNSTIEFKIEIEDIARIEIDSELIKAFSIEWRTPPTEMHHFAIGDLKRNRTTRSPSDSIGGFWDYLSDRKLLGISKSEIIQLLPIGTFLSTRELLPGSTSTQEQYAVYWPERNCDIVLRFGLSKRMDDYELIAYYLESGSPEE